MESEKYITVREENAGTVQVVIIDTSNPRALSRRPMSADAVLMNPQTQVLALRGTCSFDGGGGGGREQGNRACGGLVGAECVFRGVSRAFGGWARWCAGGGGGCGGWIRSHGFTDNLGRRE